VADWVNDLGADTPLLSEESALPPWFERSDWKKFFLLDPLDGTKEFVRGSPEYGVSLALIEESLVSAGVIVSPALNEVTWGVVGVGAFSIRLDPQALNDLDQESATRLASQLQASAQRLSIKSQPPTAPRTRPLRVLCSRSHRDPSTSAYLDSLGSIERVQVGACLKFVRLAQGIADYYPRLCILHEWDLAAGHAIVKASGGNMYVFGTHDEVHYNTEFLETPFFETY
jgi:3'(2'), 5'-bisphosphate nucleotidase